MDRQGEERILRRAIDKGLIAEQDLESPGGRESGRWGARIERLIEDGRLDEIAVAAIAEEVAALRADHATATQDANPAGPAFDMAAHAGWDHYEILAPLGRGGGGEVFRAHDSRLHRDVALKFLHADRADLAARFRREAQAQARIEHHEHVCKVYEVGETRRALVHRHAAHRRAETFGVAAAKMTLEEKVRSRARWRRRCTPPIAWGSCIAISSRAT